MALLDLSMAASPLGASNMDSVQYGDILDIFQSAYGYKQEASIKVPKELSREITQDLGGGTFVVVNVSAGGDERSTVLGIKTTYKGRQNRVPWL